MVGFFSQDLARCQLKMGEIDEALESSRNSLAIVEQHSELSSLRHAAALQLRGEALLAARRSGEAASHLERAADTLGRRLGSSHALARAARAELALAWTYQGATEKARRESGDLLEEDRGPGAR
jgi:tetratricopeptide (TPR) repeat protein